MEKDVNIAVLLGTARVDRESGKVATVVREAVAELEGIEHSFTDVRDYHIESTSRVSKPTSDKQDWNTIADQADAFVWVVPEYNHFFPGEFKLLFDTAYDEYLHKPVLLVGVSEGRFGGARVVEQLRTLASTVGLTALRRSWNISNVESFNKDNAKVETLNELLAELVVYARHMRLLRRELQNK